MAWKFSVNAEIETSAHTGRLFIFAGSFGAFVMTHLARVKDLVYDNRAPTCEARGNWRECLARE
jgi:hypothetical protein